MNDVFKTQKTVLKMAEERSRQLAEQIERAQEIIDALEWHRKYFVQQPDAHESPLFDHMAVRPSYAGNCPGSSQFVSLFVEWVQSNMTEFESDFVDDMEKELKELLEQWKWYDAEGSISDPRYSPAPKDRAD